MAREVQAAAAHLSISIAFPPGAEWMLCQEAVGVRQAPSDFQADPRRQSDLLMFVAEFDFRYGKTEVLA